MYRYDDRDDIQAVYEELMDLINKTRRETDIYRYRQCIAAIQRADISLTMAQALGMLDDN